MATDPKPKLACPRCGNKYKKGIKAVSLEHGSVYCSECKLENARRGMLPCDHPVCLECVFKWNDENSPSTQDHSRAPSTETSRPRMEFSEPSFFPGAKSPAHHSDVFIPSATSSFPTSRSSLTHAMRKAAGSAVSPHRPPLREDAPLKRSRVEGGFSARAQPRGMRREDQEQLRLDQANRQRHAHPEGGFQRIDHNLQL